MTIDTTAFFAALAASRPATPPDAEFLYDPATPDGALRLANLRHYVDLMTGIGPRVLLVGEAPGHRGATVTGVPFMSMRELTARPGPITGDPDGDGFTIPEAPAAPWEASSRVVWAALADWPGPLPMSWPIVPNHPYGPLGTATNRTPRPAEIRAGLPILRALIDAFRFPTIVAVGRKAEGAAWEGRITATTIRHPAQGGARAFTEQLARIGAAGAAPEGR